jgi:purine nucleosidase
MGGAYRHPGNTAPTTEWNIHCDPDAAKIAFAAFGESATTHGHPRPVALGLDVTEQATILPDHVVALAKAAGSTPDDSIALARGEDPMHASRSVAGNPIVRYIADALRFYMEFHARYDGFYGAFIHDALAAAAAIDPGLVTTKAVTVDVELGGTLTTGETVTDWRGVWGRPPNLDVAIAARADEFLRRFVERVGRLAADRANVAL